MSQQNIFFARLEDAPNPYTRITLGFGGATATNAEIVPAALEAIAALKLPGGPGLLINGPMSIPAAFAIAHAVAHSFAFVAVWDPKLQRYVTAISHDPQKKPGDLLS